MDRAREVGEEPGGSLLVCKTLYARVDKDADQLSFEPGSTVTITEVRPGGMWMIGTLEGKEGYVLASSMMILD